MCWEVTQRFPADTRSPSAARRFANHQLSRLFADRSERRGLLDNATLIISELITNSINAGASAAAVTLSWHRDRLRLSVDDDAPGVPTLQYATSDQSHGRGLAITQSLSHAWGVQARPSHVVGKQVWADLRVAPTLTATLHCTR